MKMLTSICHVLYQSLFEVFPTYKPDSVKLNKPVHLLSGMKYHLLNIVHLKHI